jgi:DNA-binding GntR family transcriptional regulator
MQAFFDALTLMYRVTARLAAQYRTTQNLDLIRAQQAQFTRAVEKHDALAMIATNAEFHKAIAAAARNPYFSSLSNRLLDEGRRLMRVYYSSFGDHLPQSYVVEHEDIIAAIVARDVAGADHLASAHADQIVSHLKALIARDDRLHVPL